MLTIYTDKPQYPGFLYEGDMYVFHLEDYWIDRIKSVLSAIRTVMSSDLSSKGKAYHIEILQQSLAGFRAQLDAVREMRRDEFSSLSLRDTVYALKAKFPPVEKHFIMSYRNFPYIVAFTYPNDITIVFHYDAHSIEIMKGGQRHSFTHDYQVQNLPKFVLFMVERLVYG